MSIKENGTANDIKSYFGDPANLPPPVSVDALTRPTLRHREVENIDYEPVGSQNGEVAVEDKLKTMFAGAEAKLEQELSEPAPPTEGGVPAALDAEIDPETGEARIEVEFEAEMLLEIWEDARKLGHNYAYTQFISIERSRSIYDELVTRRSLTDRQHEIKIRLKDYVEKHDKLRQEYLDAIPYSEKRKGWAKKCIEKYMPKVLGSDRLGMGAILLIVFVLPEVMLLIKLFTMKMEMPKLNLDFLEAALNEKEEAKVVNTPAAEFQQRAAAMQRQKAA